ncbi:histidine phosphatase family protein [Aestuariivirga sp.]|uniref:histidine phosphatase family protein n=1 Tax=Aestuariivirga sp. TaxID=2650926 RepID=UPI0039E6F2DB
MATDHALPIIYVRHGETDWNAQGLIQGSIDTELNAKGHAQAQAVAALLATHRSDWTRFEIIVSPQLRARQTAEHIVRALGREIDGLEPHVRELGFGIWEGKPFWELKDSPVYPADPEGRFFWRPEGGESYEDGVARVNTWRASLTRPTLVISHGAVGRCLMGAVAGLGPREIVGLPTPQGAYCRLENGRIAWFDGVNDPA